MKKKLLILSNIPTPYQLDFIDALKVNFSVLAIFLNAKEENRDWKLSPLKNVIILNFSCRIQAWHKMKNILLKFRPDFVIVGGYTLPLSLLLKSYCYFRRIEYFYWLEKPLPSSIFKRFVRSAIWAITLPHSKGILCIGSRALKIYRQYSNNLLNLPYSIKLSKYQEKKVFIGPGNKVKFLYVGQYIERKGIYELLQAFSETDEKKAQLSLVGSGELHYLVDEYAKKFKQIENIGFVNPPELYALYSKYDVLIIPSNHDGWAVVVAEAMASGLAIIGTEKTGAFEDLVLKNDCGLTCKVNKVSIISAVEKYIENVKMLHKHSKNAITTIHKSSASSKNAANALANFLLR